MTFSHLGTKNATALTVAFFFIALPLADSRAADAAAGKQKAAVCAACHGPDGNSQNPAIPSLAGQPAQMIATQLYQFREGNRKDPQMSPMAEKLSNAEMNDLAAYFASVKPVPTAYKSTLENAALGAELTKRNNCVQCHGPTLHGQQHIPRIAGQQHDYLVTQLKLFKAGKRADMDGNMTSAAQALSDKDIEVLADYVAGLNPQ
ncbi:MAG TPA: c-type cytochrome [Burkholderiales bacterium]